ncbi:ImmA/IrrE family metallo-endopeptidase [Macrococcoides canis]|nr:ImmA/IrrE family metallo-endopeptidase [Macrococcus canis]TDM32146.1 ImmA/IrrE family metallo-endopeptidase [Macrococcus canis]
MEVNEMGATLNIQPEVLKWAINLSGKQPEEILDKYNGIDSGFTQTSKLTIRQLEKLSKDLAVPFGYLILKVPPVEEIELMKYRTINNIEHSHPSRELVDTIKSMERKQDFMREALIEDGYEPLKFINTINIEFSTADAAEFIRNELNIEKDWNYKLKDTFNVLKRIVSNNGIMIMQNGIVENNTNRKLNLDEFRAFVMLDEYAPLIFLNATDSKRGMTFSLCHELVHLFLGNDELYNLNDIRLNEVDDEEHFCNDVAAELLLPKVTLIERYEHYIGEFDEFIVQTANDYSISELVVLIRMKRAKLLNKKRFNQLYEKYYELMVEKLQHKNTNNSADYFNVKKSRLDNRFIRTVNNKALEGKILYSEAYDLIGAKGETYHKLIYKLENQ